MKQHTVNKKRSNQTNSFTLFALLAVFIVSLMSLSVLQLEATSVDDYIYHNDPSYSYSVEKKQEDKKHTLYTIFLKSQSWRSSHEVDTPLWTHEIYVIVPKDVRASDSLLLVKGGVRSSSDKKSDTPFNKNIIQTAIDTHSIISILTHVPNQPLKFIDEHNSKYIQSGRREDALIAYSWNKYLTTNDPTWSIRLPMAKAIVKAMDAIQDFTSHNFNQQPNIKRFVLTGESKRAWAAWVAASSDSRVAGIIPICLELGDISQAFTRHKKIYGKWSEVLNDYLEFNIHNRLHSSEFNKLMKLESPYCLSNRILIPKLIINTTGDEFFLPDSSRLYSNSLFGETHYLLIANSGHRIDEERCWPAVSSFYSSFIKCEKLPKISWAELEDKVKITFDKKPRQILVWKAHNSKNRDFRHTTIGKAWQAEPINISNIENSFTLLLEKPENGWNAVFVEMEFEKKDNTTWRCTTPLYILPESLTNNE